MVIAINTRNLSDDFPEGYKYFIYEACKRMAGNNSEHQFIFFVDSKYNQQLISGANITTVITGSVIKQFWLSKFWYDVKLPALLKKYKAGVMLCCDGFCSLTTQVPQCLLIPDLSFLHHPSLIKKTHLIFYKKSAGNGI